MKRILLAALSLGLQCSIAHGAEFDLKGTGPMLLSKTKTDGSTEQGQYPCIALVSVSTPKGHLILQHPTYYCQGLNSWSDESMSYRIVAGHLLDSDGEDQGRIAADGSFQITQDFEETPTFHRLYLDADCKISRSEPVTFTLKTTLSFQFQKLPANQAPAIWNMTRHFESQDVQLKRTPSGTSCPAVLEPVALTSTADLTATLDVIH